MQIVRGILDYRRAWEMPDILLFTGNPTIKNNGALVMGRGAALMVRDAYPGIDRAFAKLIQENRRKNVIFAQLGHQDQSLGWFKVKSHYSGPAHLEIIQKSVQELSEIAESEMELTFHMNYPGIGAGGLERDAVEPILKALPDNVLVYL